jgi:ABC-type glutathione transport system ATPase component
MMYLEQLKVVAGDQTVLLGPLSLALPAGENLYIVGESGSGKSTLLEVVAGCSPHHQDGEVLVAVPDDSGTASKDEESSLQRVFPLLAVQDAQLAFSPYRKVFPQLLDGLQRKTDFARLPGLLDELGLDMGTVQANFPHQLSGGMLKRALLAGLLACGARYSLFDEPTSGLDSSRRWAVLETIGLHSSEFILATHDVDLVRSVRSGYLLVLRHGKKVAYGPVREVLADPDSEYVRELFQQAEVT